MSRSIDVSASMKRVMHVSFMAFGVACGLSYRTENRCRYKMYLTLTRLELWQGREASNGEQYHCIRIQLLTLQWI